jgi:hypothetical protein
MPSRASYAAILLLAATACSESPTSAPAIEPSFARGSQVPRADFTILDAGMSLVSDGKGTYVDGMCGVWGSWTTDQTYLAPAGAKVPKSQQATCEGIAPRTATLTLAVRHVSDDGVNHVDDANSPVGSGVFAVSDVKFAWGGAQATVVNASPAPCGTIGLRFTSVTYPGTNNVVRDDLGGGLWHMYTQPWPDNIAYCEVGGVASYWHVALDLYVQKK